MMGVFTHDSYIRLNEVITKSVLLLHEREVLVDLIFTSNVLAHNIT